MYVDAVAVGLVLFYGLMGYRYGLTGALINLAGMVGGYLAAVWYSKDAAILLAQRTGMSPLIALPIASFALFLLVTRGFYLLHLIVRKLLEGDKSGPSPLLTADRMGGLAFGLTKGGVIVAFLLWGLPTLIGSGELAQRMGLNDSALTTVVQSGIQTVTRYGAGLLVDDPNAQSVIAQAIARPRYTVTELGKLAANPKLRAVTSNPVVAEAVRKQGMIGLVNSGAFDEVLADREFQQGLTNIGFNPRDGQAISREDVGRFVQDMNNRVEAKMASMKSAASSPEMTAFLQDPGVQEKLKAGQISEVLQDPRLTRALGMATGTQPTAAPQPDAGAWSQAGPGGYGR
jgi:uncharacterized membrane protein required for colicin V production